ncbi:MAG: heavy-metal-associated domain-containing protein, partial [Dysgonamonadaceae bacterium]|nr:heavy-metal-associated domain-containing protein [Dysgonamonadaceae bacterium]
EGEEIVTDGAFVVDADAQLEGKPSMMNLDSGNSAETLRATSIQVQGQCEMCKVRIEKTAKNITGVSSADWNMETKHLHLQYKPELTSPDAVAKSLAKAGHDTEKYKASDKDYNALPACCKYRK